MRRAELKPCPRIRDQALRKLSGEVKYRVRQGVYRIIDLVDDGIREVIVLNCYPAPASPGLPGKAPGAVFLTQDVGIPVKERGS